MNNTLNTTKFQPPNDGDNRNTNRSEILENSKIAHLPKLPNRNPFIYNDAPAPSVIAVCAGCGGRLDIDDQIQMKFSGCRKCISVYAKIDAACEQNEKRTRRELLAKMIGGAKQ